MIMFWFFVGLTLAFILYVCIQCRLKKNEKVHREYQCLPNYIILAQPQDQNVFNISSRVQGQEQRHPDAFVSLEHINIMNELNKPPKYDDAPPSYEEAIKIAMAQSNSLKTCLAEVAASQGTSNSPSAAATSSATPQVQPAIPNRTE